MVRSLPLDVRRNEPPNVRNRAGYCEQESHPKAHTTDHFKKMRDKRSKNVKLTLTVNTDSKMLFFTGLSRKTTGYCRFLPVDQQEGDEYQIINSNMNKSDLTGN